MCERCYFRKNNPEKKSDFLKLPSILYKKKNWICSFLCFFVTKKISLSLPIFSWCVKRKKTYYYSNQDSLDLEYLDLGPPHYPNNSISLVVVCKLKLDKRHTFLLQLVPAINVSCLFTLRCSAVLKEKTTKLIKITI